MFGLFFVLSVVIVSLTDTQSSDRLGSKILSFASDGLGVATLQSEYDNAVYSSNKKTPPQDMLDELSESVNRKIESRKQVLLKLKTEAERLLSLRTNNPQRPCCSLGWNSLVYDSRFNRDVDLYSQCTRLSSDSTDGTFYSVGSSLLDTFRANRQAIPTLHWQYFASEDGLISINPAFQVYDCGDFDPRFRPWYVSAAVPEPKDVVVIIDKSGSMDLAVAGSTRMDLAKKAAKRVLDLLSPHDRIGVLAFSSNVEYPDEDFCYRITLSKASTSNIANLKSFVDSVYPLGVTYYEKAFSAVFDIFIGSPSPSDSVVRHKIILFLTDGDPLDSRDPIMQTIRDKNQVLGFEVVIMTYGLGDSLSPSGIGLLKDIAAQNFEKYGLASSNDTKMGRSTIVRNDGEIVRELGSYYSFFERNNKERDPIFTLPYNDAFGLGVVLTIASPTYLTGSDRQRRFVGVVGIDVSLAELFTDVAFFKHGEFSYAFVVDNTGVTISHPLLPVPTSSTENPSYIDISTLERQTVDFQQVQTSMINGGKGSVVLNATWSTSLGESSMEGVQVHLGLARYTWQPITGTQYSLCIVVAENSSFDFSMAFQAPLSPRNYLYYRFDVVRPSHSQCNQFGRLAVSDDAAVKIAPLGFRDPYSYLDLQQTPSVIQKYQDYLTGLTNSNDYFNPTVRA